jgi:excisionase family DNA binding protein
MNEINPNEVYTTAEAEKLLKVSKSTMKRLLKKGIIKAYKLGGTYRILGAELLRAVSPEVERQVWKKYDSAKQKTKQVLKDW